MMVGLHPPALGMLLSAYKFHCRKGVSPRLHTVCCLLHRAGTEAILAPYPCTLGCGILVPLDNLAVTACVEVHGGHFIRARDAL